MPGDRRPAPRDTAETAAAIERFLTSTRNPILLEPGEEPMPLVAGSFDLNLSRDRLVLAAWDAARNIHRRITGIRAQQAGKLELAIEKLGGRAGSIFLLDPDRPRNHCVQRQGARLVYREQFRLSLARQFPDWKISRLSAEADLEHSLSPAYPRALLRRGTTGLAAIGAAGDAGNPDGALTYGLIWLDYLRKAEPRLGVEGLVLFLPEGGTQTTCLRLRQFDAQTASYGVYVHSTNGYEDRLDARDYGNLETKLEPYSGGAWKAFNVPGIERLRANPDVECIEQRGGEVSLRVRGLEFARITPRGLMYGLETKRLASASNVAEVEELARLLAELRSPGAAAGGALYLRHPEAWLESQVRRNLEKVDARLWVDPVYGQVPAVTGCERGVIDLLALGRDGRLSVIELKASEDPHLPLQALDYWMRVEWHARRNEFSTNGYFPGKTVAIQPPRLLLVAPALCFHPTTEIILRFVSPAIDVERIGVGVEWHRKLHIAFHARGAQPPGLIAQDKDGQKYPSRSAGSDREPESE